MVLKTSEFIEQLNCATSFCCKNNCTEMHNDYGDTTYSVHLQKVQYDVQLSVTLSYYPSTEM